MKAMKLFVLATILMPVGSAFAAEAPAQTENTALVACQAKADFSYHADMMKIEGDEIRDLTTHEAASGMKMQRQLQLQGEYAVCEDQFKKD